MQLQGGSGGKAINLTHVLVASFAGLIAAAAASRFRRQNSNKDKKIIPNLDRTESGRVGKLEKFSHYVARQMGFEDVNEVPELCRLAHEYLRKAKGCEENIYEYLANERDPDALYLKLIDEFDRCILTYFAFHWNHASSLISQVLSIDSGQKTKLRNILLAATRNQRFERITKNLKVARVFNTLVEEMKAIKDHFGLEQLQMLYLLRQMLSRRMMSFTEPLTQEVTMMTCS